MKSKIIVFIVLVVTLLISYNIYKNNVIQDKNSTKKDEIVNLVKVTKEVEEKILKYHANIEALKKINIYTDKTETVNKIHINIGDKVKKNMSLITLDSKKTLIKKKKKQIEIKIKTEDLNEKKLNEKIKQRIFKTAQNDFKSGRISKETLYKKENDLNLAKINIKKLESELKKEKLDLEIINQSIKDHKIKSPINGIISKINISENTKISTNKEIIEIIDTSKLKVKINITAKTLSEIINEKGKIKNDIKITVNANGIEKVGKISKIYPNLNPQTRTIKLEILINNKTQNLKPGMYSQITLKPNKSKKILLIPNSTIYFNEIENNYFIQILENQKVIIKKIKAQPHNKSSHKLLSKIKENTLIIKNYNTKLKNKQMLKKSQIKKP